MRKKTSFGSPGRARSQSSDANLSDMVELIMEPLAAQIDRARLEILGRIHDLDKSITQITGEVLERVQAVDDSIEILAAQKARDLTEAKSKGQTNG